MNLQALQNLRLQNVLAPANATTPDQGVTPTAQDSAAITPAMNSNSTAIPYNPSHTALDAFTSAVSKMPQRQDFQPGRMRQIAAVLAGMGTGRPAGMYGGNPVGYVGNPQAAFDTTRGIEEEPFNRALTDFSTKVKPLEQASVQEEARNKEWRTYMEQQQLRDIQKENSITAANREADLKKHYEDLGERYKDMTEVANKRADAYEFKAKNPNWVHTMDSDGNLVFINPQDPDQTKNTGIKLETAQDKIGWKVQGDLKKIQAEIAGGLKKVEAQGEESRKTEGVKETNRQADITSKGEQSRETKVTAPGSTSETSTTETSVDPTGHKIVTINKEKVPVRGGSAKPGGIAPKAVAPANNAPAAKTRDDAIKYLTTNQKPVTENNVKHLLDNPDKW